MLSLGIEVNVLPAAIEGCLARGGLVVAVVNDQMPYTYGDAQVPVDDVALAVEVSEPIPAVVAPEPGDDSRRIGELVAARVPDGATLQLGIGAVPDATLAALTERRDLRVWTEMFSDGVLALERMGVLDPTHPLTTSFLFGSRELYEWADGNERIRMLRTERTNDPGAIARQIRIDFDANVSPKLPWRFAPENGSETVQVGARDMAFFTATNRAAVPTTGTATFNVTPAQAGKYFTKIQCFCFTQQTLKPGEQIRMPVLFFVDPKIKDDPDARDIQEITLSYTFYPVDEGKKAS